MTGPTIGALFAGYGGLEMGVQDAIGGTLSWVSEIDKGALKIIRHHHPDTPNLGDITTVDWATVPPVDVLTGGSPCQDLSHAGRRAGMTEGTRSNLWVAMREGIAAIRPRLVIWENVRGAMSAEADSAMEPCQGCVGDRGGEPVLRALGRVLGDLADLGYDARWHGLRAADVGAPHGRWRVFVAAVPADAEGDPWRVLNGDGPVAADRDGAGRGGVGQVDASARDADGRGREDRHGAQREPAALFRTPTSQLAINGGSQHPDKRRAGGRGPTLADEVEHLLPTPAVNDMGEGKTVDAWDEWTAKMQARHGNGNGHGKSLAIEAQRLLPTPMTTDAKSHSAGDLRRNDPGLRAVGALLPAAVHQRWGDYEPAITRWETVTGRPAPSHTEPTGLDGAPRLSPRFVEWMMGLPSGHVTNTPDITRAEALKALGNGVVPQQAAHAIRTMAGWTTPGRTTT